MLEVNLLCSGRSDRPPVLPKAPVAPRPPKAPEILIPPIAPMPPKCYQSAIKMPPVTEERKNRI